MQLNEVEVNIINECIGSNLGMTDFEFTVRQAREACWIRGMSAVQTDEFLDKLYYLGLIDTGCPYDVDPHPKRWISWHLDNDWKHPS